MEQQQQPGIDVFAVLCQAQRGLAQATQAVLLAQDMIAKQADQISRLGAKVSAAEAELANIRLNDDTLDVAPSKAEA